MNNAERNNVNFFIMILILVVNNNVYSMFIEVRKIYIYHKGTNVFANKKTDCAFQKNIFYILKNLYF
jgi:hypothetical protein